MALYKLEDSSFQNLRATCYSISRILLKRWIHRSIILQNVLQMKLRMQQRLLYCSSWCKR